MSDTVSDSVENRTAVAQRASGGRFAPGNTLGVKGRPKGIKHRSVRLLQETFRRVAPSDWAKVVDRALADAIDGDRFARDWLSRYLLPEPKAIHEIVVRRGEDVPQGDLTDEELAEIVERHARIAETTDGGPVGDG